MIENKATEVTSENLTKTTLIKETSNFRKGSPTQFTSNADTAPEKVRSIAVPGAVGK